MGWRTFGADGYRYGFNGKENDREWGESLIQDYGFRLYSPAIGKFLSVDPLAPEYPWYTPYQFASNTPIQAIDLDGLEALYYVFYLRTETPKLKLHKTEGHWLIPNFLTKSIIKVEVTGLNNSYVSYTFTPFGGSTPGSGSGNHTDTFENFKKDPLSAIQSGEYKTDQKIISEMIKETISAIILGKVMKGRLPSSGSLPFTKVKNTKGWKVGDPINNLTAQGNVPKWATAESQILEKSRKFCTFRRVF